MSAALLEANEDLTSVLRMYDDISGSGSRMRSRREVRMDKSVPHSLLVLLVLRFVNSIHEL